MQEAVTGGRKEVRLAIAYGYSRGNWHELVRGLAGVWAQGLKDPDPDVVQAFLGGAAGYLRSNVLEGPQVLLGYNISPRVAARVLEETVHYDGQSYGTGLDDGAATALLPLITRATLAPYVIQNLIAGIATVHPLLIRKSPGARRTTNPRRS